MKKTFILTLLASTLIMALFFRCKKNDSEDSGDTPTPEPPVTEQVKAPTFSMNTDSVYLEAINVEIFCETENAIIYYTLDNHEPDTTSIRYQNSIEIATTTTIKAKAYKTGLTASETSVATYTVGIAPTTVAKPVFYPGGDTYTEPVYVKISCDTEDATIRYTFNGIEPDSTSTLYQDSVRIVATTTLKAKAFKNGCSSETATAEYIIDVVTPTVATPVFTPDGGYYSEAQHVVITCETEDAKIYYTTNGSDPTPRSTEYTGPIHITHKHTVLKARAFKRNYNESEIKSSIYDLDIVCNGTFTTSDDGKPIEIVSCVKSHNVFTGKAMLRFETGDPTYYMIISFSDEEIQAGTYTFETGHDAECTGNVTIKGNPYNFIDGEMTVSVENDIYTLRFDDVSASTGSSRPITVSLNFTGNIME